MGPPNLCAQVTTVQTAGFLRIKRVTLPASQQRLGCGRTQGSPPPRWAFSGLFYVCPLPAPGGGGGRALSSGAPVHGAGIRAKLITWGSHRPGLGHAGAPAPALNRGRGGFGPAAALDLVPML